MRVGITGYDGTVGRTLLAKGFGIPLTLDVTQRLKTKFKIRAARLDAIIHLAAHTSVEYCERFPKQAIEVNQWGTAHVKDAFDGPVFLISTDHVFSGKKLNPKENAKMSPANSYGWSKVGAEAVMGAFDNSYIIRTSKLFGSRTDNIYRIKRQLENGESVEVTTLLFRSFMHVSHFADCLINVVTRVVEGEPFPEILHVAGTDTVSYYTFVRDMADTLGLNGNLITPRKVALSVDEASPRPFRGGLDVSKARKLGVPVKSYKDGLELL